MTQPGTPEQLLAQHHAQVAPLISALEARRSSKVITYFLRDNVPIGDDAVIYLYEHLRRIGHQPQIDLFLNSRGGATEVPVSVVSLIREFTDKFCVLLPYHAESAATHISLGSDEIVMTEMSQLGPVDPSRRHPLLPVDPFTPENEPDRPLAISVQDLRHFVQFIEKEGEENKGVTPDDATAIYAELMRHVHPLVIGAMEQSYDMAKMVTRRMLSFHMDADADADDIRRLADTLADSFKSHSYPIHRREAHELKLKVTDASIELRDEMWALWMYYANTQVGGTLQGTNPVGAQTNLMFGSAGFIDSCEGTALAIHLQDTRGAPAGGQWLVRFP